MGLTDRLLAYAAARPHVLLVEARGGRRNRMAAQDLLAERDWVQAVSPADADLLLVCGTPGPQLAQRVERVWSQLPGPRARATFSDEADLQDALTRLVDLEAQRRDARDRETDADGGMTEDMPGGLMMAGSGSDRDGMDLEQLQPEIGPVLPHWPAGLVAQLTLQGDVVTAAGLSLTDGVGADEVDARTHRLDRAYAVLSLAGSRHAGAVRLARGNDAPVSELRRRVARDVVLGWSLRRQPSLGAGDLWSALLGLLADEGEDAADLDGLGERLVGLELAALRLAFAAGPTPRVRVP